MLCCSASTVKRHLLGMQMPCSVRQCDTSAACISIDFKLVQTLTPHLTWVSSKERCFWMSIAPCAQQGLCVQGGELLSGGGQASSLLTSTRKQQRSIRDFFVSPPTVPSAKRPKTQPRPFSSAQASASGVSSAHSSKPDDSAAQDTAALEPTPQYTAAEEGDVAAAQHQTSIQPESCRPALSPRHVQQLSHQSDTVQIGSKSSHPQLQMTLAKQAAANAIESSSVQSKVTGNTIPSQVSQILSHSPAAHGQDRDELQPGRPSNNVPCIHDEKENVHTVSAVSTIQVV